MPNECERKMSVAQWSRELGVNYDVLKSGTRKGKTLDHYDKRANIT